MKTHTTLARRPESEFLGGPDLRAMSCPITLAGACDVMVVGALFTFARRSTL